MYSLQDFMVCWGINLKLTRILMAINLFYFACFYICDVLILQCISLIVFQPKYIVQHIFKIYMTLYIHHLFMFILDSMRTVSNDLMWAQTYDK